MKKILLASALVAGGTLALQGVSFGHGGTYRGPGDVLPPGGGSSGGGPSTPGNGGPSTPGGAGPAMPGPGTPGGGGSGPGASPGASTPGGGDQGPDLTQWQFWWGFNREPYLNLKTHLHGGAVVTGSDEYWLGDGTLAQGKDTYRPSERVIRGEIVPALLEALRTERSNDIVTGCLVALGKIGPARREGGATLEVGRDPVDAAVIAEIEKRLVQGEQEISETAAVCLGIYADDDPDNVAVLTHLLEDDAGALREKGIPFLGQVPYRTRAFAAYGLGLVGSRSRDDAVRKQIVDTLARTADGSARTLGTRDVAVACIASLGLVPAPFDPAAPAPTERFDPERGFAKPRGRIENRLDQVAWLMAHYADGSVDFLVRAHVPRAVASLLGDLSSAPWIKEQVAARFVADVDRLAKTPNEVRESCILALGRIGDCDEGETDLAIRRALMAASELPDAMAKRFALIALGQAAGRPGDEGDPLAGVNGRKGVREHFLQSLTKGQSGTRCWAALAIGVMERSLADHRAPTNADMRSAVRQALEEAKSPNEVGAHAIAAGILRDVDATDELRRKLETTSDVEALGYVAIGIGLVEDVQSKPRIQAILEKSRFKPDLLKSAAIALGLLGDKDTVPGLVKMLDEAQGLSSQAALASALGTIGDARSVEPLIRMLRDDQKSDRARGFAAVALGIVADKEALPWNAKISVDINYRASTSTLTTPEGNGILDIL